VDNLNNVRRCARRYFRKQLKEDLKDKIEKVTPNSKIKYIRDFYRDINEFKKGSQPGSYRSLFLSKRRVIKQIVVTIEARCFCKIVQSFIEQPALNFNSICRRNYWS